MKKTNHIVPGQIGPECMDSQHLVPELEKTVKFHDQLRSGLINFSLNIYLFDKLYNTIRYDTIRCNTGFTKRDRERSLLDLSKSVSQIRLIRSDKTTPISQQDHDFNRGRIGINVNATLQKKFHL